MEASDQTNPPAGDDAEDSAAVEQQQEGDAEAQSGPDESAGPAVQPVEGDQGEYVEQAPLSANPGGYDPSKPVRTSPPDASQQEGVPRDLIGGGNEDVPQGGGDAEARPVGNDQTDEAPAPE